MIIEYSDMTPYEALRNEIVITAARDYRNALRALKRNPNNIARWIARAECENFFTSDWFKSLCNVSGEMIMYEIQKEEL